MGYILFQFYSFICNNEQEKSCSNTVEEIIPIYVHLKAKEKSKYASE